MKIGVLGAGTWGVALARMLYNSGNDVTVWSVFPSEIEECVTTRRHKNLPGMIIPDGIRFTCDDRAASEGMDLVIFAVPSAFIRGTARRFKSFIGKDCIVVNVAKGIEVETLSTLTEILEQELVNADKHKIVALSGPTHAEEVALDLPTTIVAACEDMGTAQKVQSVFMNTCMRVYTNTDVLGVELCGALKNIIALAAGMSKGLGYGDNTLAALITRGMAEITRLGLAMNCAEQTFMGLAGIGDLIVTATSKHSRNNRAGRLIGEGLTASEAAERIGMVVEGVHALPAAIKLAEMHKVEMPIITAVNEVVNHGKSPAEEVAKLMQRDKKTELNKTIADINYEKSVLEKNRGDSMKRVITYGTFDLLHYGHINLLKRAKALGDYLIVVISTDEFNWNEKGKKCYFSYEKRKALVEAIRYVDLVIPETNWEQKRTDVHEYHVDTFVMGDDWEGKFDFLKEEGVEVVYLPRTPEISTTQIKQDLNKK